MTNIWTFLIQTLSVSVLAVVLLFLKAMLNDKLSPRWQYGIWMILAVRIMVPVSMKNYFALPISLWIETLKAYVENNLESDYATVYQITNMKHVFPILNGKPISVTDWIFVIYITGMVLSFLGYALSYLRLRTFLKYGETPTSEISSKITEVCKSYGLKACKTVMIKNLPSALVCGGVKPILVLPKEEELDDKVILHELMHLKYHDELQSVFWCILRCMHWCNPFLQYVFCRIENDMESLCDQRVLERLEGEARREYGLILLNMVNEKYARVPGTSSISNGGKNIKRRIAAIVRFKKYPKGMSLVSVCVGIVLFATVFTGTSYAYTEKNYHPETVEKLVSAMALARLNRCTTVAGALDTYAKGLMYENGIYIATASSLSKHEVLYKEMQENETFREAYLLDAGEEFEAVLSYQGYTVYNLCEVEEDVFEAYLRFSCVNPLDSTTQSLIVPVRVQYEDAWVVEEIGERKTSSFDLNGVFYPEVVLPSVKEYVASGECGDMKISIRTTQRIDQQTNTMHNFLGAYSVDEALKTDAEFDTMFRFDTLEYTFTSAEKKELAEKSWKIKWSVLEDEEVLENYGNEKRGNTIICHNWSEKMYNPQGEMMPKGYEAEIYLDGELVEELQAVESEQVESSVSFLEMYANQHAVYMNADQKIEFKKEQDELYVKQKEAGLIETLSAAEIQELAEEVFFAVGEEYEILEKLEACGVYQFESMYSLLPTVQNEDVEVLRPLILYNANDGSWMVACGGYYLGSDWENSLLAGEVGNREQFGISYSNINGTYDTYVLDARANLRDEVNEEFTETNHRSNGDGSQGFTFELQDYTYMAGLEKEYVGYRWYGSCIYAAGFENYDAEIIAFYQHTK